MTGHVQLCDFAKITPLEANRLFFLSRVSRFILMNHNRIQISLGNLMSQNHVNSVLLQENEIN